ncbi:MAG: hypothetical protein ABWY22_02900, partial [Flavobacterium sp.]
MKVDYKNFEIELFDDINCILNSTDESNQYQRVHSVDNEIKDKSQSTNKYAIIIKESETVISNAIIYESGVSGIYNDSFILEDDKIWILIYNKVYCLEIPSLELAWQKELDFHANFSIHKLKNDFIIHGESQIFRISKEGDVIWSFGGKDIWFNVEGLPEVTIENNTIRLFDFESNEYVLDFDGNQIEDNPRVVSGEIKKKWWKIF